MLTLHIIYNQYILTDVKIVLIFVILWPRYTEHLYFERRGTSLLCIVTMALPPLSSLGMPNSGHIEARIPLAGCLNIQLTSHELLCVFK